MICKPFKSGDITAAPYMLITETVMVDILSGKIRPGQKLPSIRQLAKEHGVSPTTAQRALDALQREGLISTHCTTGKFVTTDIVIIQQWRKHLIDKWVFALIKNLDCLGLEGRAAAKEIESRLLAVQAAAS